MCSENLLTRKEPFVSTREPPDSDPVAKERRRRFKADRRGSQDLTAGSAVDGRHKGRISYITGWIYTFHIKHRGPSVGLGLL